jgi:purine-binding chemotaxis protein CheW
MSRAVSRHAGGPHSELASQEGDVVRLLPFAVAHRWYALPVVFVEEILRAVAISPLPKAPPIVEGVINLRGAVVPVLDVRARFGLAPRALSPDQYFIVARAGERVVALRVDQALDLVAVRGVDIEAAARVVAGIEYVAGIAKLPDGLLVIHDLPQFLSLDERRHLDRALAAPAGRGKAP